jgi:hypothetical protein
VPASEGRSSGTPASRAPSSQTATSGGPTSRPLTSRRSTSQAPTSRAIFRGAHLERASFSAARLDEAIFRGARLERAVFTGAHLRGADFASARLERADFTGASLEGARATALTTWPVGFDPRAHGVRIDRTQSLWAGPRVCPVPTAADEQAADGRRAGQLGRPLSDCPAQLAGELRRAWRAGWRLGHEGHAANRAAWEAGVLAYGGSAPRCRRAA